MRLLPGFVLLGGLLLGSAACDRPANTQNGQTREENADQTAHKAGEEMYKATEKAKEATREAVDNVKKAGREVRDGWDDAKHKDPDTAAPPPRQ